MFVESEHGDSLEATTTTAHTHVRIQTRWIASLRGQDNGRVLVVVLVLRAEAQAEPPASLTLRLGIRGEGRSFDRAVDIRWG